jgi:hypothetical protein
MYSVFGVRSYVPYQAVVMLSHLVVTWLLFVVMRRAGVRPWIAVCVLATFVLFGPGSQNLVWAFQIAFNLALLFGLCQLLLADHEGPIDRRDWLGLASGAVALSCSGVAPAIVLGTGVATFIRRGVRPAAFQTVPLAVLYGVWYLLADPTTRSARPTVARLADWVADAEVTTFTGLGHWWVVAVGLAALLVTGLGLAWWSSSGTERRQHLAAPVGLLLGGVAFLVSAGVARAESVGVSTGSSRYVHVAGALALPALAVAAQAVVTRWRPMAIAVAALFLVPVVPNLAGFQGPFFGPAFFEQRREMLLALAYSPSLDEVPGWVQPYPGLFNFRDTDVAFLRAARSDGRLPPSPDATDPAIAAQVPIRLGLARVDGEQVPSSCAAHERPLRVEPAVGDRWTLRSPVNVTLADQPTNALRTVTFEEGGVEVVLPDLKLVMTPAPSQKQFVLCDVSSP